MDKLLVLCLLGVIGASVGQILQSGQCDPDIPVVENFNLTRFLGRWSEIARTDIAIGGDCSFIEFNDVNDSITVSHETVRENFHELHQGPVTAVNDTARLVLNITTISGNPINFWVLSTDYDQFALTYACENVGTTERRVYLWQLGRATSYPNLMIPANLNTSMVNLFNITNSDLRLVSHSDNACYRLSEIDAGQPVILAGQCDENLTGVPGFRPADFLGVWHQIHSYYSSNSLGSCNRAQYSDGGDRVNVVNSEIINQRLLTIGGYANVISNDGSGKLNVSLEVIPGVFVASELLVLGTDYQQWALTYTCNNLSNETKQVFSWIVSRNRQLSPAAREAVDQVIGSLIDLNSRYYQETDQSDESCFHFPETVTGDSIVFGGQCNLSIPVQSNFQAGDYMNLWHEIERYPTPFQFGACNNAFYTLGDGIVDVFNTQVQNQALLTINGVAVPVADGKLVVTFPVEGTNLTVDTDYWVLSTDYTSYSLVYSCRNINEYQQQVTFWKLSRTKQLSAQAQTAINSVISSLDILNQDYFLPTNQSVEGCFYYPEPQPGVPVVFPGTCESNINVVPNFNTVAFQGEWFEVEAYPKVPQEGQCINHDFSAGTGTAALNFVSSSVDDQLLVSSNGQLTFYAGETGGRFTLSFVSNGTTISFPYYVIATDYTNYALVYSCLDIEGTDFRGIWAWKLSRTKQLSAASNTQIMNALDSSSTVTLRNEYFEPIAQTDFACFYFPDLAPGEPVILPGQCESNLPVIQNFNATAYLGRWRLIESYPADNQIGQCNQASYTQGANGNILVYNNEVSNQLLREISGVATLVGNGSEGKLSVTFPSASEPYELWILGTDYTSYSIVYGCQNVGTQQRRLQSWKLSRDTSLSADAVAAIDAITSTVTVLNDRYYQTVNHSDDACFYLPPPGGVGPTIFRGQCDESIAVVTNFDAVEYMGLWHDLESYAVPFQDGSCPNAYYTLNLELGQVDVFNTQVIPNQTLDTIAGYANVVSDDGSAKLAVGFPSVAPNFTTPYWVLATDYTSYALVYSCLNIDAEHRTVSSWKLSRTKSMNQTAVPIINNIIDNIPVLNAQYYNVRDQTPAGCFYFPDPQPGVPVKFPGQCDPNINVVSNFNMTRFSGVWHEIETYPKEEQTGECINHEFTINSTNSLDMLSYNVIAQSLGVTEGTVEFTSNDNSARMVIKFVFNGTAIEIPYWIIDTDYDNYALAYSCVNIDDDYRGIWSWKLSRTKQLRPVDSVAINNAIENVDVLGNQYYEAVDQSSEACFFYPVLGPGELAVFPGQCGNITAMPNFNATAYLGLWRTIETYPVPFQLGTCSDAFYSLGNGVVDVYNTEVVNETLSTINGTAVAATDGTGKLYVTFPNVPFPAELLILDTDYETYSIVYSCVNSNTADERTVSSWKLSRTNSLPEAAVAAINATVNRIDVLDERYYRAEDRTPSGCFYFPEPNDSPVVFRGQCDEDILVQPNFNAELYQGTWYNIESYPAPFQDGTCGTAEYIIDNGVVLVRNTQVLNQVLDVQTGIAEVVGNAKLAVTFEVNNVNITSNYWILATDYTSFSLVYACQNINNEYKQVNSFKLSRTQNLLAAAETLINNAINNVQVLQQRYFVQEGHSENDCFFYPDNNGGDVILSGQCVPDNQVPAVTNFNVASFSGTWHEVARFPSDLQEGECATTNVSPGAQNSLTITQTIVEAEAQSINIIPSEVSTDGRGVISATVAGVPFNALYILDTDYQEYALLYGCRELANETKQIYSWKLARSRAGLSPSANTTLNQVVYNNIDLFDGYYSYTEQTSDACFHYPEFEELPDVIELEGPCDETIRGVPNFDAASYLGLWREIERYPDANQFGTCDRAYYSSGDGNVLVRNTQVLGDTLLEQLGTAAVASTDGTGQLLVNFNVNGVEVTANYYILATDYNNYALVYSCRNTIDAAGHEKRQIRSWKLSRTNTLSVQAQTAIGQVINQTQGLAQQFYTPTSQTDEDCFYVPQPTTNAPLFRGRCGTTTGVANFDFDRFQGWWHEIESYPIDSAAGECISSQYSGSGTSFQVIDTSVTNGIGNVITGTVTASNGVLTRVLSNGNTQQIVVLATDYDNYALLYSCADVTVNGEEYRRVWSAKHSKTREVASVNVTSINTLIESNNVLHSHLYQQVSQSDEACFHYSEVQDQRVIIPGQCDLNIPVVENFDVDAYGGTWYQIERYPQVHEDPSSTCVGARYILNSAEGWVDVLNWEVIDDTLETIAGTATVNSTDGSAKLAVVLPVVGTNLTVTTPLYVLDTDYNEYSLVYSCTNVNQFQRSIGAWKLSRERTLSLAGIETIDRVIASRAELDARYFLTVEQNEQCPEPSSSTLVKSSILVMLICAVIQLL